VSGEYKKRYKAWKAKVHTDLHAGDLVRIFYATRCRAFRDAYACRMIDNPDGVCSRDCKEGEVIDIILFAVDDNERS